ncbi:MAG: endonuclease MutS2, partial [Ginsengibacter sp.]
MNLYPSSAIQQLEFDKVKALLASHCRTEYAKHRAENLRIHTRKEFIEPELNKSHEYKLLFLNHLHFPDNAVLNISKELKLLGIEGSILHGDQFLLIKKLSESIKQIFRWFDNDRRVAFPSLAFVIHETYYEKAIGEMIDEVLDEDGNVKDNASEELSDIRMRLYKKRGELR